MSDWIIKAEGIGKKYRIRREGKQRYTALRDVITDRVRNVINRSPTQNPRQNDSIPSPTEDFWALKEITFDIARGEVIGFIGRNGAGKSTLLKILSRITEPSEGRISLRGRVASLLEVGTGFHPELTGRENIFLNGAILGMSRNEIRRRFDEIVSFAEVERFLDTPVKRYSSGMYVRLAFAVAAHLEPEILIVDEVLAVGDSAFQRKCLGKLGNVCQSGRTVLFVSHNLQSVQQLCSRAIWLNNGRIACTGSGADTVTKYLQAERTTQSLNDLNCQLESLNHDDAFRFHRILINQESVPTTDLRSGLPTLITIDYEVLHPSHGLHIFLQLCDLDGTLVFETIHNGDSSDHLPLVPAGRYESTAIIPADFLSARTYELRFLAAIHNVRSFYPKPPTISITVHNAGKVNRAYSGYESAGKVSPLIPWSTIQLA